MIIIQKMRINVFKCLYETLNHKPHAETLQEISYIKSRPDLMLYITHANVPVVRYLLSNGADIDEGQFRRMAICMPDMPNMVFRDIKNPHGDGERLLRWACKTGYDIIVSHLISHGADVGIWGQWPIRYASWHGHEKVVRILLNAGAIPTANNNEPIRRAIAHGHTSVCAILEEHGVDISAITQEDIQNAILHNSIRSIEYLANKGFKVSLTVAFKHRAIYSGCKAAIDYIEKIDGWSFN